MSTVSTSLNGVMSAYNSVGTVDTTTSASDSQAVQTVTAQDNTSSSASVRLSSAASKISQTLSSYAPYFPTRSGMSADALINGVGNPGSVSSSQGKSFPDVATDARKTLDANYALMKASGKPFDSSSFEDTNSLFGSLDRRSLYAVSSNQGGLFTKQEQASATYLMNQQQSLATGYYTGPPDQEKNFVDPFGKNVVERIKAGIAFLDGVSTEEKTSSYWLKQQTQMESALQQAISPQGATADQSSSSTPHMILAELMAQWSAPTAQNDPFDNKANSVSSAASTTANTSTTTAPPTVKTVTP